MENKTEKIPSLKEGQIKKLPVDVQTFEDLRMGNYIYIDKTKHVFDMIDGGRIFFLSRPRRFGKSLFLSTLQALFEDKKYLFEGLYIYDKWEWGTEYPIIKIDFSDIRVNSIEALIEDLQATLEWNAGNNNIKIEYGNESIAKKFSGLIKKLYEVKKQKVVILIDEYDKAIRNNLDKSEKERDGIREVLRDFYEVIKGNDAYIRFVFLTGLLEINGLSFFSGLNNVRNITLKSQFSDICGYTQTELESNFDYYITEMAKAIGYDKKETLKEIKDCYDGYTWDGKTKMYNPYSVLNALADKEFNNYWFESGTSASLEKFIRNNPMQDFDFEEIYFLWSDLTIVNLDAIEPEIMLFRNGYLTIKDIEQEHGKTIGCTFVWPNAEVKESAKKIALFAMYELKSKKLANLRKPFLESFKSFDEELFNKTLSSFISLISYKKAPKGEAAYQALFGTSLDIMGFNILNELPTSKGRPDIVIIYGDTAIIIEVKYVEIDKKVQKGNKKVFEKRLNEKIESGIKAALKQIAEKKYYERFELEYDKVLLIGLVFAQKGQKARAKFERIK
ncbi:MAG: ATP-binding protein [Elusimicrobiota bacterium]|jgi:uncharacterized membrane protein|nr:ATP-binding protein [Elusimicrobiota bacterium]